MSNNANVTFLRARDPITGARGSDILHLLRVTPMTASTAHLFATWAEAFARLTRMAAEGVLDMQAVQAKGRAGGVFRAVR